MKMQHYCLNQKLLRIYISLLYHKKIIVSAFSYEMLSMRDNFLKLYLMPKMINIVCVLGISLKK